MLCVFQSRRSRLNSSLCLWRVRCGTSRRPPSRSESCGFRPSRARYWPACSPARAARTRSDPLNARTVSHTLLPHCNVCVCVDYSALQSRLGSQSDALAIQSIRNVRGNSFCADCDAPSESRKHTHTRLLTWLLCVMKHLIQIWVFLLLLLLYKEKTW